MSKLYPMSVDRGGRAALRRATFSSLGFPPGTLRDAQRSDVTYGPADLAVDDGPIDRPTLARLIAATDDPDGRLVRLYWAAAIPHRLVLAEWVIAPTEFARVSGELRAAARRRLGSTERIDESAAAA
ncbi:MAG: hypothetical protein ACYDCI_10790 [Candidatus Limnocylindrales bacterium]